jgi:arylsulfatase A
MTKRNATRLHMLILIWIGLVPLDMDGSTDAKPRPSPNIILILADDQGWNGLSVPVHPDIPGSGSTYYQTPHLAKLASEGMRFSHAYSGGPTCSPSRHTIQFGRSPTSLKIWAADGITRELDATPSESLPQLIKRIRPEYITAHMGKWHVAYLPHELGYDVVATGEGHDLEAENPVDRNNPQSKDPEDPKMIFSLTRKANAFIEDQAKARRPFFLQISHYADHAKYQALEETVEKYRYGRASFATAYQKDPLWAAMNENLDTGIGMVLDKLDELGIRNNTYIIYTADNGYEDKFDKGKPVDERGYYKAFPQRSHKYTVSEGGIRVPFIVSGPGIPASTHSETPVHGADILPLVLDILGGSEFIPERVEGASILPHMKSKGELPVDREDPFFVFLHSKPWEPRDIAIVRGDYKLLVASGSHEKYLYNLRDDVGERINLASGNPTRTQFMYDDLMAYLGRFQWPGLENKTAFHPTSAKLSGSSIPEELKTPDYRITQLEGIGYNEKLNRQDPSNIIKAGGLYHVWYTQGTRTVHPYASSVFYATSADGLKWDVKGEAIGKGQEGAWDSFGVITPYIAFLEGKYYLYYTGTSSATPFKSRGPGATLRHIGVAVADSPDGPWKKFEGNPVFSPAEGDTWDNVLVDDAHIIVRNSNCWLYYKGGNRNETPDQTKWGLAVGEKPTGPFIRHQANPLIGGHTVCVWPHREGIAALIDKAGPEKHTVQWSEDGVHFQRASKVKIIHTGCGPYDPDAFTNTRYGSGICWGVAQFSEKGTHCIIRFDVNLMAPQHPRSSHAARLESYIDQ